MRVFISVRRIGEEEKRRQNKDSVMGSPAYALFCKDFESSLLFFKERPNGSFLQVGLMRVE